MFVFTPNAGMLIYRTLQKKYKKRYVLDIRDFWMEDKRWFLKIEETLIRNSFCTAISSEAYKRFLPKHEYILTHNTQNLDNGDIEHFRNRTKSNKKPIVLACVGGIKHIEYDKRVIDYFANDTRFELRYIGRGYDALEGYCKQKRILNVYCEGEFPMAQTLGKYEGADLILNMYGNHDKYLDYALSNKLYFAAQLGIPIVVCPDTYMSEVCEKNEFGIAVDINREQDKDKLVAFYDSLNISELIRSCDIFLEQVNKDEEKFINSISAFVNKQLKV